MSRHTLPRGKSSKRAPYRGGETWDERHRRRLDVAFTDKERLQSELAEFELIITTHNAGAHWKIRAAGRLFEWWPETGRVIVDKKWGSPRKAHDVDQVVAIVRRLRRRS